jgi:hypothetical protein
MINATKTQNLNVSQLSRFFTTWSLSLEAIRARV